MKKLLVIIVVLLLAGCQEVNHLIKIQDANKDITELQIDMDIEADSEVSSELTDSIGFDASLQLGMEVSMQVSNGVVHSYSTVDIFGIKVGMEQYSLVENGQRVVYTNFFDVWTKEIAEESEVMNLNFEVGKFLQALNGSFEIIDPIMVDEVELQQMQLIMTVEDVQSIFGLDYTTSDMSEEEVAEMLQKEITFVLGYTTETYLIQRVSLDLTEIFSDLPAEEVKMNSFNMIFTFSKHNDIGEIELPAAAITTDFSN